MSKKKFREGPVGAILDEYERAVEEYKQLLLSISSNDYTRIIDPRTSDPDCVSVQTITNHVIRAGYGYANYIRRQFKDPLVERKETYDIPDVAAANQELDNMLLYNAETLQNKMNITEKEIIDNPILTNWGQTYDFEQLLEHAIVHVLRHRRQIERLLE